MASFQKKPNGKWLARVRRSGHPKQEKVFDTQREAKQWATGIEAAWDKGRRIDYGAARRLNLMALLEAYEKSPLVSTMAKQALPAMRGDEICTIPVAELTKADFADYIARALEYGYSQNTVISHINIFHRAFNVADQLGYDLPHNPVAGVVRPKAPQGRNRRLTSAEWDRLYKVCDPQTRAIILLSVETSMRQGETLGLNWQKINPCIRTALLSKTKNGEIREVPLSRRAIHILAGLPKPRVGKVFKVEQNAFKMKFRRYVAAAKIKDFRFHDLRHEGISRLFEKTKLRDIEIMGIVGHKTLHMTKRYTHLRAKDLAKLLD